MPLSNMDKYTKEEIRKTRSEGMILKYLGGQTWYPLKFDHLNRIMSFLRAVIKEKKETIFMQCYKCGSICFLDMYHLMAALERKEEGEGRFHG